MYGLDEKRNQILDFVNNVSDEEAKKKPAEDRWSILEVLEHLYLMEQLVVYQINRAIKEGDIQETTSKPIHNTTDRGYKVEAPEAVQPNGEFTSIEKAKDGLEKTREATLFLIHNKDEETLKTRAFPHPAFGDMNLEQWIEFIGWHELRHLDQMKEVKQAL
ncbi:DinB family protein [Halobacillus litoralis]|uniref:DinB family protein n=1 Tax=Halobacillus litoralis TaxID=45668 RepID=UPI001CD43E89|nr:DinB family protein [Halobacillus litoralis]MCA0971995.1 DinB family protein [Halobacillus litoralis]